MKLRWIAALIILIAVVAQVFMAWNESATDDEPAHIAASVLRTRSGLVDFYPEQPPLPGLLAAIPLHLLPVETGDAMRSGIGNCWFAGKTLLFGSVNDADAMIFAARCSTIALFALLLASVCFFTYRATNSRVAALAALVLSASCPNLLAHGHLATSDLAVALFSYLAVMCFMTGVLGERTSLVLSGGAFAGCAFVSKVSGLFLVAALPFIALIALRRIQPAVRSCLYAAAAALVVVELTYLPLLRGHLSLTAPFAIYPRHVAAIYSWVAYPYNHPMFLLGRFSFNGWWWYFPAAFVMKMPLAGTLLSLFALVCGARMLRKGSSTVLAVSLFFVVSFLAVAMTATTDIGIRYMLPILPFLYTAIALVLYRSAPLVQRGGVVLIAFFALSSALAYPYHLAFFNELIPRAHADEYLVDSNLDWGQDLKRLAAWTSANHVAHLRLDYFGGAVPRYYIPDCETWQAPRPQPLPPGYFAVSRHLYRLSFSPRYGMNYAQYLARSRARFVTMIGRSILVFEVR